MEIIFNVSEEDYINFNVSHMDNSKMRKNFKLLTYVIVLIIAIYIPISKEIISPLYFFILIAVGMVVIKISKVISKPIFKYIIKIMLKSGNYNDFMGEQKLILYDDYIDEVNDKMTSQIKYTTIEKIICEYDCFFIYIGAIKAIIVPLSAFKGDSHKQEFINILLQKTNISIIYPSKIKSGYNKQ